MHILDKLWKTAVSFLADIVGLVVVPVALLWCDKDSVYLPRWAYLWCNEWDSINGISARMHWEERWGTEGVRKFWPRFLWLAIRNRSSNLSQMLGKENPADTETYKATVKIPFTDRCLKCRWGYTSYYPGGWNSLKTMPKRNFVCAVSLRDYERT